MACSSEVIALAVAAGAAASLGGQRLALRMARGSDSGVESRDGPGKG